MRRSTTLSNSNTHTHSYTNYPVVFKSPYLKSIEIEALSVSALHQLAIYWLKLAIASYMDESF